jgi:hypothetical protein
MSMAARKPDTNDSVTARCNALRVAPCTLAGRGERVAPRLVDPLVALVLADEGRVVGPGRR